MEYYFSDENLPNDKFMLKYVTRNVEGFGECRVARKQNTITVITFLELNKRLKCTLLFEQNAIISFDMINVWSISF